MSATIPTNILLLRVKLEEKTFHAANVTLRSNKATELDNVMQAIKASIHREEEDT